MKHPCAPSTSIHSHARPRRAAAWLCLLLTAAVGLTGCRAQPEWTTDSEEALAELREGLDAVMKIYVLDASEHFERALEHDPDFVAAKLFLLDHRMDPDGRAELVEELRAVDPEPLTERERFLLAHTLAIEDGREAEAEELRHTFLEEHPEDPWALAICSRSAWIEQDLERAERFFRELLETNPNWVLAQNSLGYLAMARGDFATAEERFRTYEFIAPDQANPHDSLGELFTLLGRYEEAQAELEEALAIKSDFCHSYLWLQMVEILRNDAAGSQKGIDRAREAGCPDDFLTMLGCQRAVWKTYEEGDWDLPFSEEWPSACEEWLGQHHLVHKMALHTGRTETARAIERQLAERLERDESKRADRELARAILHHLKGFRALAAGDSEAAIKSLAHADRLLTFWGGTQGVTKLYNKLHLAMAHEQAGETAKRDAVLAEVERVNPDFAEQYAMLKARVDGVEAGG